MTCPTHKTKMESETGLSAHRPRMREYRYRCEECDAEYIIDHSSRKLRMIDGRDFTDTESEVSGRR